MKPAAANTTEAANSSRQQVESPLILQDEYKPPVTGTPTRVFSAALRCPKRVVL